MRWVLPAEPKPLGWEKQVSDEKLATGERMLQKNPKQFGLEGPVVPPTPIYSVRIMVLSYVQWAVREQELAHTMQLDGFS
jgi:hypothetical protein